MLFSGRNEKMSIVWHNGPGNLLRIILLFRLHLQISRVRFFLRQHDRFALKRHRVNKPLIFFKGNAVGGTIVAYLTILVLGASFSLVPAALWPSVPKLVDEKIIGSAYALIFWIQNIGLGLFPTLIGNVLKNTNPEGTPAHELNYTWALVMLASLGAAALLIGIYLKAVDKKKHLGLEEPNIK